MHIGTMQAQLLSQPRLQRTIWFQVSRQPWYRTMRHGMGQVVSKGSCCQRDRVGEQTVRCPGRGKKRMQICMHGGVSGCATQRTLQAWDLTTPYNAMRHCACTQPDERQHAMHTQPQNLVPLQDTAKDVGTACSGSIEATCPTVRVTVTTLMGQCHATATGRYHTTAMLVSMLHDNDNIRKRVAVRDDCIINLHLPDMVLPTPTNAPYCVVGLQSRQAWLCPVCSGAHGGKHVQHAAPALHRVATLHLPTQLLMLQLSPSVRQHTLPGSLQDTHTHTHAAAIGPRLNPASATATATHIHI